MSMLVSHQQGSFSYSINTPQSCWSLWDIYSLLSIGTLNHRHVPHDGYLHFSMKETFRDCHCVQVNHPHASAWKQESKRWRYDTFDDSYLDWTDHDEADYLVHWSTDPSYMYYYFHLAPYGLLGVCNRWICQLIYWYWKLMRQDSVTFHWKSNQQPISIANRCN